MKITDEEIQKDLELYENAIDTNIRIVNPYIQVKTPFLQAQKPLNKKYRQEFIETAITRWPLYIKELKELREVLEYISAGFNCDKISCSCQERARAALNPKS